MKRGAIIFGLLFVTLCSCTHRASNNDPGVEKVTECVDGSPWRDYNKPPQSVLLKRMHLSSDSLFTIISELKICAKISEAEWDSTKEKYQMSSFRSYCDSDYFRVYPLLPHSADLFLLESSTNHGSGPYDNFIIQRMGKEYQIIQEFKGYMDTTFQKGNDIYALLIPDTDYELFVRSLCKWKGDGLYYDSIITVRSVRKVFTKGDSTYILEPTTRKMMSAQLIGKVK